MVYGCGVRIPREGVVYLFYLTLFVCVGHCLVCLGHCLACLDRCLSLVCLGLCLVCLCLVGLAQSHCLVCLGHRIHPRKHVPVPATGNLCNKRDDRWQNLDIFTLLQNNSYTFAKQPLHCCKTIFTLLQRNLHTFAKQSSQICKTIFTLSQFTLLQNNFHTFTILQRNFHTFLYYSVGKYSIVLKIGPGATTNS